MRRHSPSASLFLLPALLGLAVLSPAEAQQRPAPQQQAEARDGRTVDWYERNPYLRMTVLDQCARDPGRLRNHPDCINAQRADLADTSRRLTGNYQGPPNTPVWFSHHPEIRKTVLGACRNMNAEARSKYGACDPARQSIINDQLRLTGRLPAEVQVR